MNKIIGLVSFFLLASCANGEESNENEDSGETFTDSAVSADTSRVISQIDYVEFDEGHEEAEYMQEDDVADPENVQFDLYMEDAEETGIENTQLVISIEVEEGEELRIGSTHFRLEQYNGEEWEQIEGVPYGEEDAQAIITPAEPFERRFGNLDQFGTAFDTGIYRFVNSGYKFPFYVYVFE